MKNEPGIGPENLINSIRLRLWVGLVGWGWAGFPGGVLCLESVSGWVGFDRKFWSWVKNKNNLLFLIQFFHKFELADQRRREGIQRPFRKWGHLVPTNRLLYYNPKIIILLICVGGCVGGHTLLRIISGAKYSGVPHNVHVLPFTRFAKPKSVI